MLNTAGLVPRHGGDPDWAHVVERMLMDDQQLIARLERQHRMESNRQVRASLSERVDLLRRKLHRRRARLLASLVKMDHVMKRLGTASALLIPWRSEHD